MKTSSSEGSTATPEPRERVHVGIADYAVTTTDALLTTSGLGSCVGVALADPAAGVAGLAHVMLPAADGKEATKPAKFADTGIRALLAEMETRGADLSAVTAKIAGGASVLDMNTAGEPINERNVAAVRSTLQAVGASIDGEDVGGEDGRSLEFDPASGDLAVKIARKTNVTV